MSYNDRDVNKKENPNKQAGTLLLSDYTEKTMELLLEGARTKTALMDGKLSEENNFKE